MIIDAHLHLWVKDPDKYPWSPIGGYVPEIEAPISRYEKVMEENLIDGAVLVQPTPYGWDNSYLLDCKKSNPRKFKAVVLVDPTSDKAAQKLEQLVKLGADGLRINLHLKPCQEWENEHFFKLMESCVNLQIPVCAQLTPDYLDFFKKLCIEFPSKFIIDHLGRPNKGANPKDENFKKLLNLSEHSNIYIKLSGMNYYSSESAPYQDTWELLKTVKAHFGSNHCLWGSDYPFVEEHWSYKENLDLMLNLLSFTESDLKFILGKTAWTIWWCNDSE